MAQIYTSVAQLIGGTPLMELCRIEEKLSLQAKLIAKLEYLYNAGTGSRIAISRDAKRWQEILEEYNERVFGLFDQSGENLLAYALMDAEGVHAAEVIGIGADYLLWCCSMKPEEATGRSLPTGEGDIPVGCALALSPRAEVVLKNGKFPPYLNILFN